MTSETVDVVASELRGEFMRLYPEEAAAELEAASLKEILAVMAEEPAERAASVLARMEGDYSARVLEDAPPEISARLAGALDPQDAARILARLDPPRSQEVLDRLNHTRARELRELMTYPPDSAGGIMDPKSISFRSGTSAQEALRYLQTLRDRAFEDVFVIDSDGLLLGRVALESLVAAPPQSRVSDLLRTSPSVQATSSIEEVLEVSQQTNGGLPVVDHGGRLLGVITQGAMTSATEREASADIQMMVGASKEERALSHPMFAVRKRLPWLYVNLLTAFAAATVVGLFEGTIARITALAVLMPVVAGQSGNSGSQALAVTMRGIVLREIRPAHWRRLVMKEVAVGLLDGLAIAVVTSAGVFLWSGSLGLAIVIGVAMVIAMMFAGLAGASIPIILRKLGQDPAQSSSIFLTTVTDIVGFLSFLGLATLLARTI